jgi:hypothetical protein
MRARSFMAAAYSASKGSVRVDVVMRTLGLDHVADTLVGGLLPCHRTAPAAPAWLPASLLMPALATLLAGIC